MLSGVSGTSKVVPSIANTRQVRYRDARVAGPANGFATCSNNAFNGAGPNLTLAREIAAAVGIRHGLGRRAAHDNPSITNRATRS